MTSAPAQVVARPDAGAGSTTTTPVHAPLGSAASSREPAVSAPTGSGWVSSTGTQLTLDGVAHWFVGVNAYEIATLWGTNAGCGAMLNDAQLDDFFGSLPPNAMVRTWAWQGAMATNTTTGALDWGPLDRVVAAATAHRVYLLMSLTSQGGECDDYRWKDPAWYEGGYRDRVAGSGNYHPSLSYSEYVQAIAARYKDSPTIAMWELVNEPEASSCPSGYVGPDCSGHQICVNETAASQALHGFFDAVGGQLKALDPHHLVESGTLGGGQCGMSVDDYAYIHSSAGIDVASYHDYDPTSALPNEDANQLAARLQMLGRLQKPLLIGEAGLVAGGSGCASAMSRANTFAAKLNAARAAGAAAWLAWNWVPQRSPGCTYDIAPDDPVLAVLRAKPHATTPRVSTELVG